MSDVNESKKTVNASVDSADVANMEGSRITERPSGDEVMMNKITEVLELLNQINQGIQAVQTQKVALNDDSKLLISQMSQKTVEVGDKLDNYISKVEALNNSINAFNEASNGYKELLGRTLDGVQDLNVSIQSMVSLLSTIHETQASIIATSNSLQGVTNSVNNSVAQIGKYIIEVRAEVLKYMEAAGNLNNGLETSKELITTLNNLSGSLDVKIAGISADINSLTSILSNLNELSANLLSNINFEDKVKTGSDVIKNLAIGIGAMKYTFQKENTL